MAILFLFSLLFAWYLPLSLAYIMANGEHLKMDFSVYLFIFFCIYGYFAPQNDCLLAATGKLIPKVTISFRCPFAHDLTLEWVSKTKHFSGIHSVNLRFGFCSNIIKKDHQHLSTVGLIEIGLMVQSYDFFVTFLPILMSINCFLLRW